MLLSYSRNFFLQRILSTVRFSFCLLVFRLPLFHLEIEFLHLLPQFALILLSGVDVLLKLVLEFLAGSLEVSEVGLELFVLAFVIFELLVPACAWAKRRRRHGRGQLRAFLTAHVSQIQGTDVWVVAPNPVVWSSAT